MLIRCPECGEQISDQVERCPKCGLPEPAQKVLLSQEEHGRRRRRMVLRIVAMALAVVFLAGAGTALYLWRYAVRHDIVHYEVGSVSGTSEINQQHFANVVRSVADEWNGAGGTTVLWGLPFGRAVRISLAPDKGLDYIAELNGLWKEKDAADAAYDKAAAEAMVWAKRYDAASSTTERDSYVVPNLRKWVIEQDTAQQKRLALWDQINTLDAKNDYKETYIVGLEASSPSSATGASITITAYVDDTDLRALLLYAIGRALGLGYSSADNVMNSSGRSTTITKDLAAEVAAGH